MAEWRCPGCNGSSNEDRLICYYCGTLRRPVESPEDQKLALEQLHHAIAAAASRIERRENAAESAAEDAERDRLLRNAFIPTLPELLFEEALRCEAMFKPTGIPAARQRFDACLSRLRIAAAEDRKVLVKVELLEQRVRAMETRVSKENREAFFGCTGLLAFGALVGWIIVKACG